MSNLGIYTFGNIPVGSMFKFVEGEYKGFTGDKNSRGTAWMGTEWFIKKRGIPQVVSVEDKERVELLETL